MVDFFPVKISTVRVGGSYTPSDFIGPSYRNKWKSRVSTSEYNLLLVLVLEL